MQGNEHLYELAADRRTLIERSIDYDTGELTVDEAALNALDMKIEEKAVACTKVSEGKRALAKAKRECAKNLTEQARMLEAQADRLDDYTIRQLEECGGVVDMPDMRVSVHNSARVEVFDVDMLPEGYVREKVTREPDKRAIKEAIASGEFVPGAVIIAHKSLRVR